MRRLLGFSLVLSTLACRSAEPPRPPADPAAELDALIARIDGLVEDRSSCEKLDAALARLATSEVGQLATYARAEAALRCNRPDRWQALHEQLARVDYMPSLMRLADDAVDQRDWDRALELVEQIADRHPWAQRVRAPIIHARWLERGDPNDFAWLEQAAKREVLRDAARLEPRAALIRLYAEQAALTGDRKPLLLAQITEREARRIAEELVSRVGEHDRAEQLGSELAALDLASGIVRELEGDRIAAITAWTRSSTFGNQQARLWLGLAAFDRRDFDTARSHLHSFVFSHPDDPDARLAYAAASNRVGALGTAEESIARVIALDPADPRPYWNRAVLHDPLRRRCKTTGEFDAMLDEHRRALLAFIKVYQDAGPPHCPPRGPARPDPACVRGRGALSGSRRSGRAPRGPRLVCPGSADLRSASTVARSRPRRRATGARATPTRSHARARAPGHPARSSVIKPAAASRARGSPRARRPPRSRYAAR